MLVGILALVLMGCRTNPVYNVEGAPVITSTSGYSLRDVRDAIQQATPGGGFLADDHTLDNWKWAQWRPRIIDRKRYDNWVSKGRQDMTARANKRARDILAEHQVPPLPGAAEEAIADILKRRA